MAKAKKTLEPGIGELLNWLHYPVEVILLCVRWYLRVRRITGS